MDRATIDAAIAAASLAPLGDLDVTITGDEPILPSPHRLATGAAVARLLSGVGANELWCARGGASQALSVDASHAAAALLSFLYSAPLDPQRQLGVDQRGVATQLTRIFATRDGRHIQLHGSFHDAPAVCDELGLGDEPSSERIAAAVLRRDAFELESALIARDVCGGVVMCPAEWDAHPQGQALAALPLVRLTRIGDAAREPLAAAARPATGIRVLDMTRVLAGPTCAKTLAEHGADVLHVTNPRSATIPAFDFDTGIGKRQCALDLEVAGERAVLVELARGADVVTQGYRTGALERRGLGPRDLAAVRPGIIYVSENCYGPLGPWSTRPGWEQLAQAATGMSWHEGEVLGAAPRLAPAAANDYATGWLAAYGAMLALARRASEGGSWLVECSLAQTAAWYRRLGDDLDPFAAVPLDATGFLEQRDSVDFGPYVTLRPALSMSQSVPSLELGPARDGAHEPVWLSSR